MTYSELPTQKIEVTLSPEFNSRLDELLRLLEDMDARLKKLEDEHSNT